MDNTKNPILLTVIAVATLLVAVVGATFAYFTAQGGKAAQAEVTVKTGTAASTSFGTWDAIAIYADQTTFAQGAGDATGSSTGEVSWTAPGATQTYTPTEAERTMCYTATLQINTNTFVVSSTNTTGLPELVFKAEMGKLTGETGAKQFTSEKVVINDLDITTTKTNIQIPTTAGGKEYVHKLVADAGKTVNDAWKLTVTLKNLDVDQNDNAGKEFTGAVVFDKATCPGA